jgi:hypothetical protein
VLNINADQYLTKPQLAPYVHADDWPRPLRVVERSQREAQILDVVPVQNELSLERSPRIERRDVVDTNPVTDVDPLAHIHNRETRM